jgi:hypothetical protein
MRYLALLAILMTGCSVITWAHPTRTKAERAVDARACLDLHGGDALFSSQANPEFRKCMADKGYIPIEENI